MCGSDSGPCFSPSLFWLSVSLQQRIQTYRRREKRREKKECTLSPLSPSWATNTNTPRQTRPLESHTQPSAFDSVCIRGALGPLLQSSSVLLLLLLLLLVASLGSAPVLPFAERRQQAATRLVSTKKWMRRHNATVSCGCTEIRDVFRVLAAFSRVWSVDMRDDYSQEEQEGQARQPRWKGEF